MSDRVWKKRFRITMQDLFNVSIRDIDGNYIRIERGKIILRLVEKEKIFNLGTLSRKPEHHLWLKIEKWDGVHWKDKRISIPLMLFQHLPEDTVIQFYFPDTKDRWEITHKIIFDHIINNRTAIGQYINRGMEEKIYLPYELWTKK